MKPTCRTTSTPPAGRGLVALLVAVAVTLGVAPAGLAQPAMPPVGGPEAKALAPDAVIKDVGVDQRLGDTVPADLTFTDATGKTVRIGDYYGKRPLVLSLVYYECPGLCTMTLNGVARSLKPLTFTPGNEFDVLTVSFNPADTPQVAAAKKKTYLKEYLSGPVKHDPAAAEAGWHFLTGDQANIDALTKAVGFRYSYDPKSRQFAHASAIMVLTPQGKISRYFYGLEYSSRDIRLGVIEASEEKIGTVTDAMTLFCYQYNPASGKYSLAILRGLRVAAVLTVVGIGSLVFFMVRRERRQPPPPGSGDSTTTNEGPSPATA